MFTCMRNKSLLFILCFLCNLFTLTLSAQSGQPWGCGDDNIGGIQRRQRSGYDKIQQQNAQQINEYIKLVLRRGKGKISAKATGISSDSTYTIPVVVHVIYPSGEPYGTGNNISYAQIRSQVEALNAAFGRSYPDYNNQTHPSYAKDTRIRFCLARTCSPATESWSVGPGGTEYGVKRYEDNSGLYNHLMAVTAAGQLKALTHPSADYFPFDRYLNIWLVKTIDGGDNVMGYAPKPLSGEYPIDGVVMRADVFGDNTTGGNFSLGFNLTQGKILAHEIGHYFNLYHIFQGGCAGANKAGAPTDGCDINGDYICDIKPCTTQNVLCNTGPYNTCHTNYDPGTTNDDMINDYMSYADDDCMNTFTQNQAERMWATLELLRHNLWQPANLAATGVLGGDGCVPAYLNASINTTSQVFCAGRPVFFSNTTVGNTAVSRQWSFPGATPSSAISDTVTVQYSSPGNYTAVLLVSDGSSTRTDSMSFSVSVCKVDSSMLHMANWYFGEYCSLDFSTGVPVKTNTALNNKSMHSESSYPDQPPFVAATVSISDSTGKLLFYSNGVSVWNSSHKKITNTPMFGISDINASTGLCYIPYPEHPGKYFVVGVYPNFDEKPSGVRFVLVDVIAGTVSPYQEFNHPSLPKRYSEYLTVVPHCNGTDYWIITKGYSNDYDNNFYVFRVTASGINITQAPVITTGIQQTSFTGSGYQLKANRTGDKLIISSVHPYPTPDFAAAVYDFDSRTGLIKNERMVPNVSGYNNVQTGISFSPNGEYFYLMRSSDLALNGPPYWLFQYRVSDFKYNIIATTGFYFSSVFQLGPDNQLYIANSYNYLARLSDPDNWGGATFEGEFISFAEPSFMMREYSSLPAFIDARPKEPTHPEFDMEATDCNSFLFSSLCYDKYNMDWNFGDGSPHGSGSTVNHVYDQPGDYDVTLTVSRSSKIYGSVTKKLTVLPNEIRLTGPDSVCNTNTFAVQYFAQTAANADIRWSAINGKVSGADNLGYAGIKWNENADSGKVQIEVSTSALCKRSATKKVVIIKRPVLSWLLKDSICITDKPLELNAVPSGGVFTGSGITENIFTPDAAGLGYHELTYRYGEGLCLSELQQTIKVTDACSIVSPPPVPSGPGMPSAFTPNGDGLNDVFRIPSGLVSSLQEFSVYSRWGEKIFTTQHLSTGWNGSIKGAAANPGVYIYFLSGMSPNGKFITLKGTVVLIR